MHKYNRDEKSINGNKIAQNVLVDQTRWDNLSLLTTSQTNGYL